MQFALVIALTLGSGSTQASPFVPTDTNCTMGAFATCASTSVSLKTLPNGEVAAVIDAENLRGRKLNRNAGYKPRGDFNLRFPTDARPRRMPKRQRAGEAREPRPAGGAARQAKPDSTE